MYTIRLILFVTHVCLTKSSSLVAPSRLLVTRIGPCHGTSLLVSISEMGLMRKELDFSISGELNISVDVANGWSIKATMQKCHDIRNLDTCDLYKAVTMVNNGCAGDDKHELLLQNKFFQHITPRLGCPLQAGVYQISNYPFLTEHKDLTAAESKISTSVFGYTYRIEGFDEEYQKILCVDAYLQLIYIRKHNWISNQKLKPVKGAARNLTVNNPINHRQNDDDETKDVKHNDNTVDDKAKDAKFKNGDNEQDNKDINHDDDGDVNKDDDAVYDKNHGDEKHDNDDNAEAADQQSDDDNDQDT